MAWRNLRLGRGDRQGALRLAGFAVAVSLTEFLLRAHFVATVWSFSLFIEAVGQALWIGALLWLAYIALEPVVRRLWPRSLITWTRLLSGRWQDALVARDVLIGLLVGLGYDLVFAATDAVKMRMGATPPAAARLDALLGFSRAFYTVLDRILDGLTASLLFFLLFFLFRLILRKEWLAGIGFVALFVGLRGISTAYPIADIPAVIIVYAVIVFMLLRCGLLALVVTIFITDLLAELVFTTNFSAWYGAGSLFLIIVVSGLAIFAFRKSLGGHRISAALLDQ
jgi:serine/threonine-protein kinase